MVILQTNVIEQVLGGSGLVGVGWKNSRNHRDRLCIMAEMLKIAKGGALKTPIMYKANLNSAQLDEYLSLLLEVGLLEAVNNGEKTVYKTTAKGLHYIQGHKKLTALIF